MSNRPPVFVHIGNRTVNASQIKWVGVQDCVPDDPRVQIEFITGGFTQLERGITLGQFRTALDDAVQAAEPY